MDFASIRSRIALLNADQKRSLIEQLGTEDATIVSSMWEFQGRPEQQEPAGKWRTWLYLAGRGAGKTRTGMEWVRQKVESGQARRVALVTRTAADGRDVIVEGNSGFLACSPKSFMPKYEPSKRRLEWPNGAIATLYSSEEPDLLRGPQHDLGFADEVASWRYPDAWDQLMFGLRLGDDPRVIVTTTPRPTALIKRLLKDPTTVVRRGRTLDNKDNLAPSAVAYLLGKYRGTRLGRQELDGEVLEDFAGALWSHEMLDSCRVRETPEFVRVVVAVDPSGSDGEKETDDAQGIVVVGLGTNGHYYVLDDVTDLRSPAEWGAKVIEVSEKYGADLCVAERNFGGAMVEHVISTAARAAGKLIRVKLVTASRGKHVRAEPIAALYEQGKVHHIGEFPDLENEQCACTMTGYVGDASPNRLDAAVWGISELSQVDRVVAPDDVVQVIEGDLEAWS